MAKRNTILFRRNWFDHYQRSRTLTAEESRVAQVPLPTRTLEPTLPRLPPSPTTTPVLTISLTATVQSSAYRLNVMGVKKVDSYKGGTGVFLRDIYPDHGCVFLEIRVQIYKNGVLTLYEEQPDLSVVDSKGAVYLIANRDTRTGYGETGTGTFTPTHYIAYFSVPITATGFKLRYRDVPLIDLGI